MGRRDQFTSNQNPAALKLDWKGDKTKGYFEFYTKDEGKTKVGGIKFAILAERHSVGGYSEKHKTGLYSNEVDNIADQELVLRKYEDGHPVELCRGIYKDMAGDLAFHQAKYQKVVYAVILDCDEIETGTIVRFVLSGSSVSAWFDLQPADKQGSIAQTDAKDMKKGSNDYKAPIFESGELSDEEDAISEEKWGVVDSYIKGSPATQTAAPTPQVEKEDLPEVEDPDQGQPAGDDDDIPF